MRMPIPVSRILPGEIAFTPPVISLLFANLVTIVLAIVQHWDLATVMFIYWAQSIIIGIFTVISLLGADTAVLAENMEKSMREKGGSGTVSTRFVRAYMCLLAGFFALHYGLFHWGYYGFIVESGLFGPVNFPDPNIWFSCALFFANHLYSHIQYRHEGPKGVDFVNEEFFRPYQRIIPMHLTIIFGSIIVLVLQFVGIDATMPVLVLFLLLKTRSDIFAHLAKHAQQEHPDEPVQYIG